MCVQSELEAFVHLADIGGIVEHHCLNILLYKELEIKFVPDFYGPEAGISRNDNVMDMRGQS